MGKRVKVNLTMDEEVVKEAKKIGINLSQFCENALREAIKRLKGLKTETNGGTPVSHTVWRGVRDLNPRGPTGHRLSRPAPYQARVTPLGYT